MIDLRPPQPADQPPSSVITAPFTLVASSLASHETRAAIWSGSAKLGAAAMTGPRRSKPHALGASSVEAMLVATPPGRTALHRIPSGAYIQATERVRPSTACFEVV